MWITSLTCQAFSGRDRLPKVYLPQSSSSSRATAGKDSALVSERLNFAFCAYLTTPSSQFV